MRTEVVVLSRSLPVHGLGGMEIVAWDLSRELVRLGQPVRIVTTPVPGRSGEYIEDGVCVVPLPNVPAGRYSSQWWRASRQYFEKHCLNTTRAVLSVSAAGFGLLPLKKRLPSIPFIMQAHGTSWGEALSKWRSGNARSVLSSVRNLLWLPKDLLAYRQFDTVIGVGERVFQDLCKLPVRGVLPTARVHLINNGIDTAVFCPDLTHRRSLRASLGIDDTAPVVISASRLHVQKGVHHGIRAFAELLKQLPDACYLIAGDGPELQSLQALARNLGLTGRVRFLGSLDRPRLAEWFQASDAFLFLTEHVEVGLTLNVMEALACGLPALVSDHLKLFPSPTIHLIPPRDAVVVAERLRTVLEGGEQINESQLPDEYKLKFSAHKYLTSFNASTRKQPAT